MLRHVPFASKKNKINEKQKQSWKTIEVNNSLELK